MLQINHINQLLTYSKCVVIKSFTAIIFAIGILLTIYLSLTVIAREYVGLSTKDNKDDNSNDEQNERD